MIAYCKFLLALPDRSNDLARLLVIFATLASWPEPSRLSIHQFKKISRKDAKGAKIAIVSLTSDFAKLIRKPLSFSKICLLVSLAMSHSIAPFERIDGDEPPRQWFLSRLFRHPVRFTRCSSTSFAAPSGVNCASATSARSPSPRSVVETAAKTSTASCFSKFGSPSCGSAYELVSRLCVLKQPA